MNIRNYKKVLPVLLKHNIVPFVWGLQGVGKTQVTRQAVMEANPNSGFVHLHLATQEVGDLVGLLMHNADGTVKHARPEWFPEDGEGVIFLDELNRAHPDVVQSMFSFITSKTIHTHKLPDGWKIIAAGNYDCETMTVTDTSDAAWMSRFCHIDFTPTKEEFVLYAESRSAVMVADFISEHDDMLEGKRPKVAEHNITPDRRAWLEMVAKLEEEDFDDETRFELYKGVVGTAAASSFCSFRKSAERKIRLKDITRNYKTIRARVSELNRGSETRFDALNAPLEELIARVQDSQFVLDAQGVQGLKEYFADIPLELVCQVCKKLGKLEFRGKNELLNDAEFNAKLFKVK